MSPILPTSRLDKEPTCSELKEALTAGRSNHTAAVMFETSEASIRRFRKRHGLEQGPTTEPEGITLVGTEEVIISSPVSNEPTFTDEADLMDEYDLDPEDWESDTARISKWGGPENPHYHMRLNLRRKRPELQIMAPRTDGWVPPYEAPRSTENGELVVIVGDQQAPFQHQGLHRCFFEWLRVNQPHRGISLGDTFDFPDIRPGHRFDPENTAPVNECLQAGYDIFRDYVQASLATRWTKLLGNHDERLRNVLLDTPNCRPLYGMKQPDSPEREGKLIHSLGHAACLDELGIELVDCNGSYEHGQVNLSDKLAVRHGWIARKGSGSSALATLESLRYSVVVGHTHRQSIVYNTTANIDGEINTLVAAEAGSMCRIDINTGEDERRFPSYAVMPDWQNGFMTATIWPDGKFHLDPAIYVNDTLLWRDQRYEA